MSQDKRTFRIARIAEDGSSRFGIFTMDGQTLIGEADPASLQKCAEELTGLASKGDEPARKIYRNPDGSAKNPPPYRSGAELTKLVAEHYAKLTDSLPDELADLVLTRMKEDGSDFTTALREATKTPQGARLWNQYQESC